MYALSNEVCLRFETESHDLHNEKVGYWLLNINIWIWMDYTKESITWLIVQWVSWVEYKEAD